MNIDRAAEMMLKKPLLPFSNSLYDSINKVHFYNNYIPISDFFEITK